MSKPQRQEKKEEQREPGYVRTEPNGAEIHDMLYRKPPQQPEVSKPASEAAELVMSVRTAEEVAHNLRRAAIELRHSHDGGIMDNALRDAMGMVLACVMPLWTRAALEVMLGALDRGHGSDKAAAGFLRKALELVPMPQLVTQAS